MKKPRSDSKLKTLPEDVQRELANMLRTQPIKAARAWLRKEHGVTCASSAFTGFRQWWDMRERFQRDESRVEAILDRLSREQPDLSKRKLFDIGQTLFAGLAIEREDNLEWYRVQRTELNRDKFDSASQAKIEAGLKALYEEIKGNAAAEAAFANLEAAIQGD